MAVSVLFLSLIGYTNSISLNDYSEEYINFMHLYRFPIVLGNDYYLKLLNIGDKFSLTKKITKKA